MSRLFCAFIEALVGFVIWSFLGWWLALVILESHDALSKLPRESRTAIRCSAATAFGIIFALVYARRSSRVHEGLSKPGRTFFTGKGGKLEVTSTTVAHFWVFALAWAWWIFLLQASRHPR
jgi:hypothetical protein